MYLQASCSRGDKMLKQELRFCKSLTEKLGIVHARMLELESAVDTYQKLVDTNAGKNHFRSLRRDWNKKLKKRRARLNRVREIHEQLTKVLKS